MSIRENKTHVLQPWEHGKFYAKTISSGSSDDCEKCNVREPLSLLSEATDSHKPFVFVSRDIVFDMSSDRTYKENSRPDSKTEAGKMLAITEKAVMEYDKGLVFRVQHLMSDVTEKVLRTAARTGDVIIADQTIRPVTVDAVMALGELLSNDLERLKGNKVAHVVIGEAVSVAGMIYGLLGEEEIVDLSGEPLFEERRAAFFGDILRDIMTPIELLNLQVLNERGVRKEMATWKRMLA